MPPQRIAPTKPASKPVKSERTHEENQERYVPFVCPVDWVVARMSDCHSRAYIAASRRSDRSLEARIESARRASKIHKKRTGRALRVTEADVINEKMYDEEDGDVTTAYRNLSVLMGGGPIDRRFAAYYQHQVHMRNAVDRELHHRMAMSQTGVGVVTGYSPHQMSPGQYTLQQQQYPFFRQPLQQRQQQQQQQPAYRQPPYAPPVAGGHSHGRAMSMHIPQQQQQMRVIHTAGIEQKLSRLTSPATHGFPGVQPGATNLQMRHMSAPAAGQGKPLFPEMSAAMPYQSPPHPTHMSSSASNTGDSYSLYPLSGEIPAEAARFFAGTSGNGLGFSPYGNPDQFDYGTTYTTSKGFTTSLSPSQQSNPFESKTEDGLATTTGKLKWQPSRVESPYFNAGTVGATGFLNESQSQEDDLVGSLFSNGTMLMGSDAFGNFDAGSVEQFTEHTADQEVWGEFANQAWLLGSCVT